MDVLSLYSFLSFTDNSWEVAAPSVFSLDSVYQIVINVLGTPQLIVASIDRFTKAAPIPNHAAAVVTLPTLWWCTSCQDLCIYLKFMTI